MHGQHISIPDFTITLDEIKEVVRQNYDKTVEFVDVAPAEQYRETLRMQGAWQNGSTGVM